MNISSKETKYNNQILYIPNNNPITQASEKKLLKSLNSQIPI